MLTLTYALNMISHRRQPSISENVKDFMKPFQLKKEHLCALMQSIDDDLRRALKGDTTATLKCYQTYVQDFPTGAEKGNYMTLDLGGAHFRVIHIKITGAPECELDIRTYTFPEQLMVGTSQQFFDYIAECVEMFLDELKMKDTKLGLGFCFSFPVKMKGLTKAYLSYWVKKFRVSGVEGQDVVALLKDALNRKNLNIDPIVVLNDTTACLLSSAWKEHTCRVGVIIGTGTNICYAEKIENIANFDGDPEKPQMVINTEIGNFCHSRALNEMLTEFDRQVDSTSKNPGSQIFEKMISSMYFSELVRLTILKGIELKYLFEGETSEMLTRKQSFLPEFIYEIEGDTTADLNKTLSILEIMKLPHISIQDCVNVRYICKIICQRSAYLLATAIATVLNKMDMRHVTVAYDGGVYRKHPNYKDNLKEKIKELVNPSIAVEHILSEDGSSRGAALILSLYMSQLNTRNSERK